MKKTIISLCILIFTISCGDSAYVKQLKSDLAAIEIEIENETTMCDFYRQQLDSVFMTPNPSDPDVVQYIKFNIDKQDALINELKSKRKDIELKILKEK